MGNFVWNVDVISDQWAKGACTNWLGHLTNWSIFTSITYFIVQHGIYNCNWQLIINREQCIIKYDNEYNYFYVLINQKSICVLEMKYKCWYLFMI